jgi:hypothetical protein
MKMNKLLAATAVVAAFTFATPAMAQSTGGVTEAGPGSADDNLSVNDSLNDFLDLLSNNDLANGDNRDNTTGSNLGSVVGNNFVSANQLQVAVINNSAEVVSTDGEEDTGYDSGDNRIGGSSFAAFAGINSLTQNSGINNINQTGVNIAAQGTVNLGGAPQ